MNGFIDRSFVWPPEYDALFAAGEVDSFDLSADWFRLLAATALDKGVKPSVHLCDWGEGRRGIMPLALRQKYAGGTHVTGLTSFYTSMYRPLLAGDVSATELAACLSQLVTEWKIDSFRCDAMDPASPVFSLLWSALDQAGFRPFRFFGFGNWYLPVAGRSYEAYFHQLSSRVRHTVQRREKRFLMDGRGELSLVMGGDDLEEAIAAWSQVYGASWKTPEPFPEFMPGLIRMCARRNWLRLGLAYYDGEPVAAQLWIVSHGRAAIYKLAYDAKYAQLSAGTVLTAMLMRQALDVDKVHEVDYLIGDDAYKRDWMTHRRERWGIVAYNPRTYMGFLGLLDETARLCVKRVQGWLQGIRDGAFKKQPGADEESE